MVVDETHMLGDSERGTVFEDILDNLRFVSGDSVQLVCLSVTVSNIKEVAVCLDEARVSHFFTNMCLLLNPSTLNPKP